MFTGATAFKAKFTCTVADKGPPNSCTLNANLSAKLGASSRRGNSSYRLGTSTMDKQVMYSINLWNILTTRYSSIITGIVCFSFGIIFNRVFSSFRNPRVHEDVDVLVPLNGAKKNMKYSSFLWARYLLKSQENNFNMVLILLRDVKVPIPAITECLIKNPPLMATFLLNGIRRV